jgi:hypothetical protein
MNEDGPPHDLHIYGWFTASVLAEAERMIVPLHTRLLRRAAVVGGIVLAAAVFVFGGMVAANELRSERSSGFIAICCVVPGYFLIIWALWRGARVDLLKDAYQEAANPFDITLSEIGIQVVDKRNRTVFVLWDDLLSFREGQTVILVRGSHSKRLMLIPIDVLYDSKLQELRDFLSRKLRRETSAANSLA